MRPEIILWGKGKRAEQVWRLLKNFEISAVIDSDRSWHGRLWHGVKVMPFEAYLSLKKKPPILVTPADSDGIVKQLKKKGIDRFILFNDFVFKDEEAMFPCTENYDTWQMERLFLWGRIISEIQRKEEEMMSLAFYHVFLRGSSLSIKEMRKQLTKAKVPVVNVSFMKDIMSIICDNKVTVSSYGKLPSGTDCLIIHGLNSDYFTRTLAFEALRREVPIFFTEDAFLRSIEPVNGNSSERFVMPHGVIVDRNGLYINAYAPSSIENILNSAWELDEKEKSRTEKIIALLKKKRLSKYNCQQKVKLLRSSLRPSVLVIDQVYGDKSISLGLADDESTFKDMLESAIEDNPDAEIYVKAHPVRSKGHFANVVENDRLHILSEPTNPIELLEQMDKVYVCSSQMGFEALMCGKEVHVYGMPFYAGWGATIDKRTCLRRTRKREVWEIFYVAYILCTIYVSYRTNNVCEIEQAVDELIELRNEYIEEQRRNI